MKKYIVLLTVLLLVLTGCGKQAAAPTTAPTTQPTTTQATTAPTAPGPKGRSETKLVILLPDEDSLGWGAAGEDLLMMLQNLTYQVELHFAKGDSREQVRQLTTAVEDGVDGIIIAPVESAPLMEICAQAEREGIPIFSYDRLLMDTEAVDYYVSFDYRGMGNTLGDFIINEKSLTDRTAETPVSIEFFMGSPEDNNALLLYKGIMEQLQPYLASGVLVAGSGRTAFEDTCVVDWDAEFVAETFASRLAGYYKDGQVPDVICTVSDSFVDACVQVLLERGVSNLPLITGLGGSDGAIMNMEEGKQAITASVDMLELNDRLVQTVDAVMTGKEPEINTPEGCHNNAVDVPAYLCPFTVQSASQDLEEDGAEDVEY